MNITTIIPPRMDFFLDVIREDVLNCLKRQPNVPITIDAMMENIAGVSHLQVLRALLAIEGPVASADDREDAYVHRCRITNAGVYIT